MDFIILSAPVGKIFKILTPCSNSLIPWAFSSLAIPTKSLTYD